ncbi:MAG: hypothetical protein ACREAK_04075 [Nitrosarchaeum sp.]
MIPNTLHIKLPTYLYDQIHIKCKETGCSSEDFVKKALELAITGYTEFDFKDKPTDEGN